MSFVLDSPEATSLGGAIRPLLESGKSEELKQQKSESKSQYDRESVTHPSRLKPTKDLKESDFSVYDDYPHPVMYVHKNFTYMNKAMIDRDKALAEFKKNRVRRGAWDVEPVPSSLWLCGGIRPYTITEKERPLLIHYSNLSLNKYNAENQGANFVFHDLVKATWLVGGFTHYITFKATDASSNSSVAQTFQAKVTYDPIHKGEEAKVRLIRLKPTKEESNTQ